MIRKALPEDCEPVLKLAAKLAISFKVEASAFKKTWADLLPSEEAVVYVLETDGEIRAYLLGFRHLTFYANGPVGYVEEIMVDEPYRSRGLGRELMEAFESWAKAQGCHVCVVSTRRAAEFYKSLGYEESAAVFRKLI